MRCLTPFWVKEYQAMVPCGKCAACYARRVSQWSFRILQEYKQCDSAHFITLTYNPESVPYTECGKKTLNKNHIPQFIKKLRSWQRRQETKYFQRSGILMSKRLYSKIKYYAVGEYGTKTKRPHYHLILFNATVDAIEANWPNGEIQYGTVNSASVGYTLKYMSKTSRIGLARSDYRTPQFALMSQGLGLSYLTPTMIKWHKDDLTNRMFCRTESGCKISMPRYYKLKIYNQLEKEKIANEMLLQELERLFKEAQNESLLHDSITRRFTDIPAANRRMQYNHSLNQKL